MVVFHEVVGGTKGNVRFSLVSGYVPLLIGPESVIMVS